MAEWHPKDLTHHTQKFGGKWLGGKRLGGKRLN
jgi:hypothetical protein